MELRTQKRIAGSVLKCSTKRVYFSPDHLEEIKEAITKQDIRELINANVIQKVPKKGVCRVNARKQLEQKRKGRRTGQGSRKGKHTARLSKKEAWVTKVRKQRTFLKELKTKSLVTGVNFNDLYSKVKGGFFRSLNHLKYFMKEKDLFKNVKKPVKKEERKEN